MTRRVWPWLVSKLKQQVTGQSLPAALVIFSHEYLFNKILPNFIGVDYRRISMRENTEKIILA